MHTSSYTAVMPGPTYMLRHENNPTFARLDGTGRAVAGLLTGMATSAFTDDAKPEDTAGYFASTNGARILVLGDSDFFSDEAGANVPGNLNLVINAVDYLVGDEELIALRGREVTTRPLKELETGTRRTLKWINILGPSVLIVVTGLWRWRSSRRRLKILSQWTPLGGGSV